jgi:hypothetical protein
MVLAGKTIFVAGPPQEALTSLPAFQGKEGAILGAYDTKDGKLIKSLKLESLPVYDGMAAADKRLFISTTDGKILCLGAKVGGK